MTTQRAASTSAFGELDIWLARAGRHEQLYEKLGAHPVENGVRFAVWAPNARYVSVVGDFNGWDPAASPLRPVQETGIWEGVVESAAVGQRYKYHLDGHERADPLAFEAEVPPSTASIVFRSHYEWGDDEWLEQRRQQEPLERPLSIYEVHAPSWRKGLGWRGLAEQLVPYVKDLGFSHIELLPVMHHPFSGSWGYQVTGYYAPLSTLGPPDDFRFFVDACHRGGVGVILDWVPAHFPRDAWALAQFDGTALYEHDDPKRGSHPDWGTLVFNLGRSEVQNFLLANALFWLREYHADGIRVDAVASMLYLDYSRKAGEWVPNQYGGREDLEAVNFLKEMNELIHAREPGVISAAEESTAWPAVSRPTYVGGLGFGFKWNMGWMHDVLDYMRLDPVHRKYHQNKLTFGLMYAWSENFVLPLSHDEVVHGKGSLLARMPGDDWQRFANLRAVYGFMWTHPGKKLLFMGGEIGQRREWHHDRSLDWHLLGEGPYHRGLQRLVRDLNHLYRGERALHELDSDAAGFAWIDCADSEQSVVSFVRRARDAGDFVLVVCNFTPLPRQGYRVGVPRPGYYRELLNSDAGEYGGGNLGNAGGAWAEPSAWQGQPHSLALTLPPLAVLILKPS